MYHTVHNTLRVLPYVTVLQDPHLAVGPAPDPSPPLFHTLVESRCGNQ